MHLKFRNVNDAFRSLVTGIHDKSIPTVREGSRNGGVLRIPEPVILTYERPCERVLTNRARDCNPFMHLYESLWMLAGRNDVAPLAYYAANMRNYSDDGVTLNGAYGYRWRHGRLHKVGGGYQSWHDKAGANDIDQLDILVEHLKADPSSRRAVLSMWNVEDDLLKIGSPNPAYKSDGSAKYFENGLPVFPFNAEGREGSKDTCCNLSVAFSIRGEVTNNPSQMSSAALESGAVEEENYRYLDMTVFNRSNDLIWGCLGANAVHFSFLQEYMAARIGVEVGVYNQVSNNLHVYESNWKPEEWLSESEVDPYQVRPYPTIAALVKNPVVFEMEVKQIVELNRNGETVTGEQTFIEPFLDTVAQPMFHAFHLHKQREYHAALNWVERIGADDWKMVAREWILKRKENWERHREREVKDVSAGTE